MVKKAEGKRLVLCRVHLARWRKHHDVHYERVGENTYNWKGGRRVTTHGYIERVVPRAHPLYQQLQPFLVKGTLKEHRLLMAETLGRALHPWETVHHINGNRADNRPENLQLRAHAHGAGQVAYCGACGSRDIRHLPL